MSIKPPHRHAALAVLAGAVVTVTACQPAVVPLPATDAATSSAAAVSQTVTSSGVQWGSPRLNEGFDGTSIDSRYWGVYNSPTANPFPRSASRAVVRDGELKLTGGKDAQGRDVSGGVSSTINQKYGRWEARFRVDRGSGYSAVVLLWPQSERWPDDGEIDLIEVYDGARIHAGINVHNGPSNRVVGATVAADFSQWHTIAADWLPTGITVYLDNRKVFAVAAKSGAPGVNPVPTTSPMHLALQLDKGCVQGLPCRTASTPAKVVMHVGSVRVFRYPG